MFQTISMRQLEEILNRGGDFVLLDVRDREEYERGHLEGAVNLPLSEIEQADEIVFWRPENFQKWAFAPLIPTVAFLITVAGILFLHKKSFDRGLNCP